MNKKDKKNLEHDKKLGDINRLFHKQVDNIYNDSYCLVCVWCGELILDKENICLHYNDIYHLPIGLTPQHDLAFLCRKN